MSDLLSRLKAIEPDSNKKPCTLGRILQEVDAETAQVLQKLLDNPKVSNRVLHSSLRADYKIDRQTISEHRAGYCRCRIIESDPS